MTMRGVRLVSAVVLGVAGSAVGGSVSALVGGDMLVFEEVFDAVPGSDSCLDVSVDGDVRNVTDLSYEVFDDESGTLVGTGLVWEGQMDLPPVFSGRCVFEVGFFVIYADTFRIERSWSDDVESFDRDELLESGILVPTGETGDPGQFEADPTPVPECWRS